MSIIMEKTPSLTRLKINDTLLYVKLLWKPNENDLFQIRLYDGETTWSGRFSYEFAKKYQERCQETEEQYYKKVKKAFRKDPNFMYSFISITDDNSSAKFSWKNKMEGTDTIVHGCVPVHRQDAKNSRAYILDFLLAENQDLRSTVDAVNIRNAELTDNFNKCKKDLDKFVEVKTSLETSLYDKFEQLLNAKKRRMELLEMPPCDDGATKDNKIGEEIV